MKRILAIDTIKYLGKQVRLCGWVNSRRDHGKVIFIDLRDRSGFLQVVFTSQDKKLYQIAQKLRPEWVIEVIGEIKKRPKGMENPKIETGKVEILVKKLEVLNESNTPPFDISADSREVNEEIRLKYRYLDLRTERMRKNLILRHKIVKYIRDFMDEKGFIEIETPILTKSTPEGARDFVVPSRFHPGKFYALPQSPQQYKQLLMVGGIERYFQIVRCLRDEDPRADRQVEFTQLDIEMSFIQQEEILKLIEELYTNIVQILIPQKKITQIPFPRLSYKEAMEKYGTDRPDLRKNKKDINELAFAFIVDFPLFGWSEKDKRLDPMHHIFTAPKEEDIELLDKTPLKARSWQHDLVLNGNEIGGGSIRINNRKLQEKIFELVGIKKKKAQEKFGHLLEAFKYGAPPEGGIALGIDRLVMLLADEQNIREVIAFPKTGDARSPMMNTPSEISQEQLKELHLKIEKEKK